MSTTLEVGLVAEMGTPRQVHQPGCFLVSVRNVEPPSNWWIRTARGDPAYHVEEVGFERLHRTTLSDRDDQPLAVVLERLTGLRDSATVERPGKPPVTLHRLLTAPGAEAWRVFAQDVGELILLGDLLAHRATLRSRDRTLARVQAGGAPTGEYQVTIADGADRILILATLVAVDRLR